MVKHRGQPVVDKILDTADRLFYFQGYNNTGINQVVEEADIAKASLYKHFDSKTDLMVAYLERLQEQWYERIQHAVNKATTPKSKLLAIFDHHIERQELREFGGCPFIKANDEAGLTDPRILKQIQKVKEQSKKLIHQLVIASGHKKLLSDRELTDTIYYMLEGAITAGAVFKQNADLKTAKKIIQKLI